VVWTLDQNIQCRDFSFLEKKRKEKKKERKKERKKKHLL
jgi:hypothetical protein